MAMQRTTLSPRCCCGSLAPRTDHVSLKVLAYRDLEHELLAIVLRLESVQDRRQLLRVELDCGYRVSDYTASARRVLLFFSQCCGD